MGLVDTLQSLALLAIVAGGVLYSVRREKYWKKVERDYELFKCRREKLDRYRDEVYARLTDPETIDADFEKSARAREMRDANRRTLPREGAGPPAKVHRPKLRGVKPASWRLNRA